MFDLKMLLKPLGFLGFVSVTRSFSNIRATFQILLDIWHGAPKKLKGQLKPPKDQKITFGKSSVPPVNAPVGLIPS